MLELSKNTIDKIKSLFPDCSQNQAMQLIMHECGNNLPFCEECDEFEMERIRFAALKLSNGNIEELRKAIKLAQQDWRDLLMAAGFGEDTQAHKKWFEKS